MTCNHCSSVSTEAAKAVGAPEVEATWAENREHPRFCSTCHGFLRKDGGCTKCETADFSGAVQSMTENLSGDTVWEDEWEPGGSDEPEFTAMAIAAVRSGKTLTWQSEDDDSKVERELRYDPLKGQYGVESFYYEVQGEFRPGTWWDPPEYGELVLTKQEYEDFDNYEEAYGALQLQSKHNDNDNVYQKPDADYFEANLDRIDSVWLNGFVESSDFNRDDGQKILEAIRQNAVKKLAVRRYNSQSEIDQAVSAINANTLKHSAQVMVMATKISRLVGADPQTARRAGLAAGYHDSGKDNTNFVYHHLDSAHFAQKSLWDTGLAQAGGKSIEEAADEVAAVRQAVMEHMPFGDGSDPGNFMNRALAAEAAGIVKVDGADYKKRLRYLMGQALQQDKAAIRRVESWIEVNAGQYQTKDDLAEAIRQEFGGRELSYPSPASEEARILHTAAAGEHRAETIHGRDDKSLLESFNAGEITWAADGLTLSSSESLDKIVRIHQVQWGKAGTEPLVVSMSSLAGGAFGNVGTAVDAAGSMTIPAAQESAEQEIKLMREFMTHWQAETFDRWGAGPPAQSTDELNRRKKIPLLQALEPDEMLKFQPGLAEFSDRYRVFLEENSYRRGELFR